MIALRQLAKNDSVKLCRFYNGLSHETIRTFRPLGLSTDETTCLGIATANAFGSKYDLVACDDGQIVGWSFLWDLENSEGPTFGLGVSDSHRRRGIGSGLIDAVIAQAVSLHLTCIRLTVVKDNVIARSLYQSRGFSVCGEHYDEKDDLDYYHMMLQLPGSD